MRLARGAAVVLAGAILCTAGPALAFPANRPAAQESAAEVFTEDSAGRLVHSASGFAFPRQVARLGFVEETAYAPDNVSVRYGTGSGLSGRQPWLDLFIYPGVGELASEAGEVGQIIVERYDATPVPSMRPLPRSAAGGQMQWYSASINGEQIITGYVLVRRGGWSMKVRGSSPATAGSQGIAQLLDAIDAIQWEWTPVRAPQSEPQAVVSS